MYLIDITPRVGGDKVENNEFKETPKVSREKAEGEPSSAFVGASWLSLLVGVSAYLVGLYNAGMERNEKGYYLAVLLLGLYSAVSLQKAVRDQEEDVPVTSIYMGISWFALISSITLMSVGLWNAGSIVLSEKGFYAMSFVLSLFSVITIQKNIRDTQNAKDKESELRR